MEISVSSLWDTLNTIIGSRQQVYIRQRWAIIHDIVTTYNTGKFQLLSSGSKSEGLNLFGSDSDCMHIMRNVVVKPVECVDADLIMDTRGIKPGFVKLVLGRSRGSMTKLREFRSALTPVSRDKFYLSSSVFRDILVDNMLMTPGLQNTVHHGPCASLTLHNKEFDALVCLPCKEWPIAANEWICRHRINHWPSKTLVKEIVGEGVLLVPIGNPLSQENHMEWRISFSLAEKKLVHSMNHTQITCYGLLKLYLKHVIDAREDCKGLLCSYFLKTALFYSIEQDDLVWNKSNLLNCFWACFKRLFAWVRQGYCPSFFIQTNNMFESKIFGQNKERLKEHLFSLYQTGTDTFTQIPEIYKLINKIGNLHLPFNEINELKCDIMIYFCKVGMKNKIDVFTSTRLITRENQRTLARQDLSPVDCIFYRFCLTSCHLCLTQHLYQQMLMANGPNSSKYKQFRQLSRNILRYCTGYDICTGFLMYATLHYLFERYSKVVAILEKVLTKFRSFVLYFGDGALQTTEYIVEYMHQMCGKGYSMTQKINSALAMSYPCLPICNFYPTEIQHEVKELQHKVFSETYIPPKVYCYVLLFLTYHKTGNSEARNETLHKLCETANDHQFIGKNEKPLVSKLIDKCVNIATTSV